MTTKTSLNELEKLKDKSFVLKLSIPQKSIQQKYHQLFGSFAAELKIDGFRPGKVPPDVAASHLSPEKILEETFSQLASDLYTQKIKEYKLVPITTPKVSITNPPLNLEKDWQFELRSCEMPEITLDPKLIENVKKTNLQVSSKTPVPTPNEHLNQILELITKTSRVDLPQILIEDDIEHKMSHLVDQVQQAGLTVNQYLKSKNTNLEQYQNSLKTQISEEWLVNLAVSQIAKDNHLTPLNPDVDLLIKRTPHLANNRSLAVYILTQQQVFDFLKKL